MQTKEKKYFTRKSECQAFGSDLRINFSENGLFTYPDVSIICGEIKFFDEETDTVVNPKVIFEVLSKSTENYDRGGKFKLYRDLKTLDEYILVSQDNIYIEHFQRQTDKKWLLSEYKNVNDTLVLKSINSSLNLTDIYARIKL